MTNATALPTIVEFLADRLNEDSDPSEIPHGLGCQYVHDGDRFGLLPCDCGMPARWRAEIAAKRAIIHQHGICDGAHECPDGFMDSAETEPHIGWEVVCMTQRHLASVYSDHPDYREEWKP